MRFDEIARAVWFGQIARAPKKLFLRREIRR
jgi:hypothetical protein